MYYQYLIVLISNTTADIPKHSNLCEFYMKQIIVAVNLILIFAITVVAQSNSPDISDIVGIWRHHTLSYVFGETGIMSEIQVDGEPLVYNAYYYEFLPDSIQHRSPATPATLPIAAVLAGVLRRVVPGPSRPDPRPPRRSLLKKIFKFERPQCTISGGQCQRSHTLGV